MKKLQVSLLKHLSQKPSCLIAATEVQTLDGVFADVLAIEDRGVVEYELKASYNDCHNEFRDKTAKHQLYAQFDKHKRSLPQYFVLVLPAFCLTSFQLEFKSKANPSYGIMIYDEEMKFSVVQRPKKLNDGKAARLRPAIYKRLLADYANLIEKELECQE